MCDPKSQDQWLAQEKTSVLESEKIATSMSTS